jgi:hypothetical protein
LETRQHEIRQAQFGVRSLVVRALPTYLALSHPDGANRGGEKAFADVGDANPRLHDKSLFKSGRLGKGLEKVKSPLSAMKDRKTQLCASAGPSIDRAAGREKSACCIRA